MNLEEYHRNLEYYMASIHCKTIYDLKQQKRTPNELKHITNESGYSVSYKWRNKQRSLSLYCTTLVIVRKFSTWIGRMLSKGTSLTYLLAIGDRGMCAHNKLELQGLRGGSCFLKHPQIILNEWCDHGEVGASLKLQELISIVQGRDTLTWMTPGVASARFAMKLEYDLSQESLCFFGLRRWLAQ